jgi:hypothetical protein
MPGARGLPCGAVEAQDSEDAVVRCGSNKKTAPWGEPESHGGFDEGEGGKEKRWMGTPMEINAPAATVDPQKYVLFFYVFPLIFILLTKICFSLYQEFYKGVMGWFLTNLAECHSILG